MSVNIYLRSVDGKKNDLLDCGSIINETLLDSEKLVNSSFLSQIRYLDGKSDNESVCVAAILSPHHFYYEADVWICQDNYTFVEETWDCVLEGGNYEPNIRIDLRLAFNWFKIMFILVWPITKRAYSCQIPPIQ